MAGTGQGRATLFGVAAILMWAALALLSALAGAMPPFQLTAMCLAIGAVVGLVAMARSSEGLGAFRRLTPAALALGIYGLLGFHAAYFSALAHAPVVDVSVITYTWPLMVVLLSFLLPKAKAEAVAATTWTGTALPIFGAVLGFGGAALVPIANAGGLSLSGSAAGYGLAVTAAVIWATYSVGSRVVGSAPASVLTLPCALSALGAGAIHLATETTVWPQSTSEYLAIAALGLGPLGAAFFVWDIAMKQGDIRLVGVLSYATPLLSTGLLIAAGKGEASPLLWLAVSLVVAGATLAGLASRR
jgi:drug/metabolite transporter (DMT)-like permease